MPGHGTLKATTSSEGLVYVLNVESLGNHSIWEQGNNVVPCPDINDVAGVR